MTWVIVIFTVIMGAWIFGGLQASSTPCPPTSSNCEAYLTGQRVGQGAAITIMLGIWFIGFIILSIIWFMTRPTRRICPACGHEARKGQTICKKCGYNFAIAAHAPAVSP